MAASTILHCWSIGERPQLGSTVKPKQWQDLLKKVLNMKVGTTFYVKEKGFYLSGSPRTDGTGRRCTSDIKRVARYSEDSLTFLIEGGEKIKVSISEMENYSLILHTVPTRISVKPRGTK